MNHRPICAVLALFVFAAACGNRAAAANPSEVLVDVIVASVNGQPITLRELAARLPREVAAPTSLTALAANYQAMQALEAMIMERVLLLEAEARRVNVSDEEIARYMEEVATRNGMDVQGLTEALAREGKSVDQYKEQIKLDIVRSKLASNYVKATTNVTEEEVDRYLDEHPSLTSTGSSLKLRRIFISSAGRSPEQARQLLESLRDQVTDTQSFAAIAAEHSEGPEKADGGSLGLVAEKDLSPDVFDAVLSLEAGQISEIVEGASGYQLFLLEERLGTTDTEGVDERIRAEVKRELQARKFEAKLHSFFTSEILKNHTIEKKI
ncbi:MAG: SurA N-terminal domain-containing protein [Bdellovibrionota bacterium]|nr:MAG: SurA N-terminal domain-containing protein [Bdellovibrionota bacterium]